MHAVARSGPFMGLVLLLLAPFGSAWGVKVPTVPVAPAASTLPMAAVGEPAPEIALPLFPVPDESHRLADYRGKVVYLDFWSSWCAPCRRSMPQLDALREAFPRSEFEVVGVNVDADSADAERFLQQVSVGYPVVVDSGGEIAARFGIDVLPALVVIDAAGIVRERVFGADVERLISRTTLGRFVGERRMR